MELCHEGGGEDDGGAVVRAKEARVRVMRVLMAMRGRVMELVAEALFRAPAGVAMEGWCRGSVGLGGGVSWAQNEERQVAAKAASSGRVVCTDKCRCEPINVLHRRLW